MFVTVKTTGNRRGKQRCELGVDIEVFFVTTGDRLGFENADRQFRHVHLGNIFRMFFRLTDLRGIERQAFQRLWCNRLRCGCDRTRLNRRRGYRNCSNRGRARLRCWLFSHRLRRGGSNRYRSDRLLANGLRHRRRCDFRCSDFGQVEVKIEIIKRKLEVIVVETCEIPKVRLLNGRRCYGRGCLYRGCGNRRRGNQRRLHSCSRNDRRSLCDGGILNDRLFAASGNGIFRNAVDQLIHRRKICFNRLFCNRRRKGRRSFFRLNEDGLRRRNWFGLWLDPGCRQRFGPRLDSLGITSRNITARAEIGKRQTQAGKFQRRTATMRRRTHGNRCRRFGDGDLYLIGKIESLRLRRMALIGMRNIARNIGRKLRHSVPGALSRLDSLRLFPCSLLVNHRLGRARLARMHIEHLGNRTGIITEIRADVLRRRLDVIVNVGLIGLGKWLLAHFGCGACLEHGFVRWRKLRLTPGENRFDALHEVAGVDARTHIVCRVKNDRIGMRRIVNLELSKQLVFEIEFGFAAGCRRAGAWRSFGTRMRRTLIETDDTRQFCQRIVVSEPFRPGVPVIRDIFFDHYVFHHLRIAALASVL